MILLAACGEVKDSETVDAGGGGGADAMNVENTAPTITSTELEAEADQLLQMNLVATDAENDNLTWTAAGLPIGASLSTDGVLSWTPTFEQMARFEFEATVTDDGDPALSDTKTIGVEVRGAYVRILISNMTGSEPITISTTDQPELFKLSPAVESVTVTAVNPAAMSKQDDAMATWRAAMTPMPPASEAGRIEITVSLVAGETIDVKELVYTTSARFASNPTSFQVKTNVDSFANTLSTINLDAERTERLPVDHIVTDRYIVRFVAGNDFGEFGGGQAGFSTNDVEIRR